MDYIDKKITLDDGVQYLVIEQVNYEDNTYLYLTNVKNMKETCFVEVKDDEISMIEPKLFEEKILPLFVEKLKK